MEKRPYAIIQEIQSLIDNIQPVCPEELQGREQCELYCPHVEKCESWKTLKSLFRDPFIVCCCGARHKNKCLFGKEGDALFGKLIELLSLNRSVVVIMARIFGLTHY